MSSKELRPVQFYLRALLEPANGVPYTTTIPHLGEVKLYVCLDKKAPNRWMCMRRPRIFVEDKGGSALAGYAAVFLCENEVGNAFLASMEDPTHSNWHEDNAESWTPKQKKLGRDALREIRRWIRDTLLEIGSTGQTHEQDIAELADFLPADDSDGDGRSHGPPTGDGRDEETGLEVPKPWDLTTVTPRKAPRTEDGRLGAREEDETTPAPEPDEPSREESDEQPVASGGASGPEHEDEGTHGDGGEPTTGDAPEGGTGPNAPDSEGGSAEAPRHPTKSRPITPQDVTFRSFATSPGHYRVVLHAARKCHGSLELRAIGEDGRFPVLLEAAACDLQTYEVSGAEIQGLSLRKGESLSLELQIRSTVKLSLGVSK